MGREAFIIEARELLEELEMSLLALETDAGNMDLIGRVFRAMHTLKGSGGMFGFLDIESFAHGIESVLDKVRDGKILVDQSLIDLTLLARDQIERMLNRGEKPADSEEVETVEKLTKAFLAYDSVPANAVVKKQNELIDTQQTSKISDAALFHIFFEPVETIFQMGTNPLLLLNELAAMGNVKIIARAEKIPSLLDIVPEICYTAWDILLATEKDENSIQDVFIFVEDECELHIQKLAKLPDGADSADLDKVVELLLDQGSIPDAELKKTINLIDNQFNANMNVDDVVIANAEIATQLDSVQNTDNKKAVLVSNIRVASEKLDRLVDLVGELVIAQARLQQTVSVLADGELLLLGEEMERLTNDLRDTAMDMRLVPIGTLFSKFKRLIRDLSHAQGKEIRLEIIGGETELDKNVIEKLNDPLIHIIRNCIDHGIEPAATRLFAQKSKEGTIRLSAGHAGAQVEIIIEDDGCGLNTEVIRKKAIKQGLIIDDQELSDFEIHQFIFNAGFSTKDKVTNLSGRGVGMDVVRRGIEALRGTVKLESEDKKGTRITIRLPLTLGIIEGLLTRIDGDYYVFPLAMVEECVELRRSANEENGRHHLIHLRDQAVPYIRLRDQLLLTGESPAIEQILITDQQGEKYGFVVDEVIGEQQVVIKSLGKMMRNVDGLSGATILGDGTVALILDVQRLVEKVIGAEVNRLGNEVEI
ncbi:chemotaxis protein CheA [bacterium]|nr:chemotaxis protein CheA [bacterium]